MGAYFILLQNSQGENSIDPKLQELMSQLEANLRSNLNKNERFERGDGDEPNTNGIVMTEI